MGTAFILNTYIIPGRHTQPEIYRLPKWYPLDTRYLYRKDFCWAKPILDGSL